jgi:hypothetical protein
MRIIRRARSTVSPRRVAIRHTGCGQVVEVVPVCSHCGERLELRSITAVAGPGASEGDRRFLDEMLARVT